VLLGLTLALLAAAPAWGGGPLPVVTTSTDLKSLVEAVGGDRVRVQSLAPPIHEPHQVEVKPGQLAGLRGASLLVRIGLDHEPWLGRVLRTVNEPRFQPGGPNDLDVSRGITLLQTETPRVRGDGGVHVHGFGNPHYWLDPDNARPISAAIAGALARLDRDGRPRFEQNRQRFLSELDARLKRWTEAMAPHRGARVVVVHDTWPYFAQRFGLVVVATVEPNPGVPPSPAHLASLIQQMKAAGIAVLVAGPESDATVVNQVASRSGARVVTLIPSVGGDPAAGDYLSLFDVNVKRLAEALSARR
jgi:ABC-type Zn uptake system ZnuABC Zn-binding protein ZnuA